MVDRQVTDLSDISHDLEGQLCGNLVRTCLQVLDIDELIELSHEAGDDHLACDVIIHQVSEQDNDVQSLLHRVRQMLIAEHSN